MLNFSQFHVKNAVLFARLLTVLQILLFLPLTLATLSTPAFLLFSLLLWAHSLIHGTLILLWGSETLSLMQVPMHPFLLLVCFNAFSQSVNPYLMTGITWWGQLLTFSGPLFIAMEGLSSLLVVQKLGQAGKKLISEREEEGYQFGLLIAAAVAYVTSAWWIVAVSRDDALVWFSNRLNYLQGLSCSRGFAVIFYSARCSGNSFYLPYAHRVLPSANKYNRVIWISLISRLQHMVMRL